MHRAVPDLRLREGIHLILDACRQPVSALEGRQLSAASCIHGKRVAMVTFSPYPEDPRPRRAAAALVNEGMTVDLICLADGKELKHLAGDRVNVLRVPVRHRRGGVLSYAYEYAAFILAAGGTLAVRSLNRRYDLVYVHNMPDILVISALVPKALGAKVILDLHDPMPELMKTIFNLAPESTGVRFIERLERWSIARADAVITVNLACKRIFSTRSCRPDKITVVMNSPDEEIFCFQKSCSAVSDPSDKRVIIMYHGSLVERNGLDVAVDALIQVRKSFSAAELRIFGHSTPFFERVMDRVRSEGLQESVRYLGPRRLEDLVPAIQECDVGIIPNHKNAFTAINTPTRIFEYLALGKPVIVPRTPGIEDYFGPDSLVFFEPGESADLAQKIVYVASHIKATTESARRGQQVYLEHTWSKERAALVKTVTDLLRKERP